MRSENIENDDMLSKDDGISITCENVRKLLDAARVKVEAYWVDLFVDYFSKNDLSALLTGSALAGAGGSPGAAASGASADADAPAEPTKEEKKEEEVVVELAGGFDDLFG
jgi:large subunit ribosomal protein LP1